MIILKDITLFLLDCCPIKKEGVVITEHLFDQLHLWETVIFSLYI